MWERNSPVILALPNLWPDLATINPGFQSIEKLARIK
jgi:hypothetical protein